MNSEASKPASEHSRRWTALRNYPTTQGAPGAGLDSAAEFGNNGRLIARNITGEGLEGIRMAHLSLESGRALLPLSGLTAALDAGGGLARA